MISSIVIGVSALISGLNTNIDNIMIDNICGLDCLPQYKMHSIITMACLLFSSTYVIQVGNKISRYQSEGTFGKLINLIKKGWQLNLLYTFLLSPGIFLLLPKITNLMTGGNYILYPSLILIFLISGLIFGSVAPVIACNIQLGLERETVLFNFLALITNIVLNFLMIPILGIVGAALATMICSIVSLLTCSIIFYKKINATQ